MKKIRRIKLGFALLMVLTGAGIFAYPFISNAIANRNATMAVKSYESTVETMEQEKIDAIKLAAQAYNSQIVTAEERNARGEGVVQSSYIDLSQLGEAIGYITIPKLDLQLPIYEGTGEEALARGVGHLTETSYPLGGESTHSALSAHRGLAEAELFTNLDQMAVGDRFFLHVLDEVLAYQVDRISVVLPTEVSELDVIPGEDLCTLLTCTPLGINSHRLLVRGIRVPYEEGEEETAGSAMYQGIHTGTAVRRAVVIWPWLLLAAVITIGLEALLMLLILRRVRMNMEDD